MKVIRSHIWLSLAVLLFSADVFLSDPSTFFHVEHQRLKILHKVQVFSSEDADTADVDLFERNDDSDRLVPFTPPSGENTLPITILLVLPYILIALYLSKIFLPHYKISFHSLWQKTTTSL